MITYIQYCINQYMYCQAQFEWDHSISLLFTDLIGWALAGRV